MPGIPYQSKLGPYEEWIMGLRATRPPTPFRRIAGMLKSAHGLTVSHSVISDFVKIRAKWNKKSKPGAAGLQKAQPPFQNEPAVDAAGAPASASLKSDHAEPGTLQGGSRSQTAQKVAAARARIQALQNAPKAPSDPRWEALARLPAGPLTLKPKHPDSSI